MVFVRDEGSIARRPGLRRIAPAATLAFALLVPVRAAADARPITLAEAVALAQRNAPQAIQAAGQGQTSAPEVRSAYAAFVPTLSLSAGATRQPRARARVE